jgi:diacylglycerol kinase (ATP)
MSKKDKAISAKLIVNPGAGKASNVSPQLEQVVQYLTEYGVQVDVAFAAPKKKAIPIVKKAVKDGYDSVIAMGGDGTISAVIRGLAGSKVNLGIIPAGTMNDIAKSLGIPEDVQQACALIASGQPRKMDLGVVRTKQSGKFYFFQVVAIGLTATIFPKIKKIPKGNFSRLQDAIRTFLEYETKPTVYLTLDDESQVEVKTMLATISNIPLIGAKNLVAPEASAEDGLLDVAVYPDFSKAELLNYFLKTTNEGTSDESKLQRYRARKVIIKSSPKMEVGADGIKLGKGIATINIDSSPLHVYAPTPVSIPERAIREAAPVQIAG